MKKIYVLLLSVLFLRSLAQNNALSFNSDNDNVTLGYSQSVNFNINDNFTIELWVKTTAGFAAVIWSNHVDVSPFAGYEIAIVNGKAVMDLTKDYVTEALRVETNNTVNDGNWHHLAFVYKGIPNLSGCEIFIDGISQPITANPNNLTASSTVTVSNEVHVGSRDNTTYFSNTTMDELRIWKRALCAAEIQAQMNCSLTGGEFQLEAYYKFDQGIAAGNNSTVTTLIDQTANAHTGTLTGFALTGATSNWIASTASVSGVCSVFGSSIQTISGTNTLCSGMTTTLTANVGSTFTWMPGNIQNANAIVSPTATTAYTVYATTPAPCVLTKHFTVTVINCAGVNEYSKEELIAIYPNPSNGHFTIDVRSSTDIILLNALGQKILETKLHNGTNRLELNDLNEGIYFICGENTQGKWKKKVVVCR